MLIKSNNKNDGQFYAFSTWHNLQQRHTKYIVPQVGSKEGSVYVELTSSLHPHFARCRDYFR